MFENIGHLGLNIKNACKPSGWGRNIWVARPLHNFAVKEMYNY